MKTFRKTFRMEVFIEAETEEEANLIFEDLNLLNLEAEKVGGVIEDGSFVESYDIEEEN